MRKSTRGSLGLALVWLAAASVAPSCGAPQTLETGGASSVDDLARPPVNTALSTALDAYFSSVFPAGGPGGAVLVMKHERVVFQRGYGIADLKTHEPVSSRTLFNLGSISKTFVANAILMLQEQGKLSVEDDLWKYFPGFKSKDIASRVKLKHLLTHTSGLPDNREVEKNFAFYLTAKDPENWYPITQADALRFEPGTRFEYSSPAFNGLALIVEQVSGVKWQDFVHDRILMPAGMPTSTITDGAYPETGVAHAYLDNEGSWKEADYGEIPTFAASGNGGVWSSVDELARYELALRHGAFLSLATLHDARTVKTFPNWTDPAPPHVGWSWFIRETPEGPRQIGHTGRQGGFAANYVTIPEKDVFFVVLSNTQHDPAELAAAVRTELAKQHWLD